MITSAYTADHIKKSGGDVSKGTNLGKAYTWAWSTAVMNAFLSVGMAGVVGVIVYKMVKPKAAGPGLSMP